MTRSNPLPVLPQAGAPGAGRAEPKPQPPARQERQYLRVVGMFTPRTRSGLTYLSKLRFRGRKEAGRRVVVSLDIPSGVSMLMSVGSASGFRTRKQVTGIG